MTTTEIDIIDQYVDELQDDPALEASIIAVAVNSQPQTDEDLWHKIHLCYGYKIPRVAVCDGHVSPMQAVADLYFMRNPENDTVWTGGRGSGKTLDLAMVEHLLMHDFKDTVTDVGAVEEQAQALYRYVKSFDSKPHFRVNLKRSILSRTEYHNSATLQVIAATERACNGPHTRVLVMDEFDQTSPKAHAEAQSIPISVNGRRPQTVYTSSLKYAYGPMIKMMDAADAGEKAINVHTWCVFEIIEKCLPERHQDGAGCLTCPLAKWCLDEPSAELGDEVVIQTGQQIDMRRPGPGKAARADGFMPIDDVIKKFRTIDIDTLTSQWLSKRPSVKGLIYPQFGPQHVIEYQYNPALPVFVGVDFGFTNASAVIYLQLTADRRIVVFAEDYKTQRTDDELGWDIIHTPWFDGTAWRRGDPSAAGGMATLRKLGIQIVGADNTKDITKDTSGIKKVRWALAPQAGMNGGKPLLYFARTCEVRPDLSPRNIVREMRTYHIDEPKDDKNADEKPVKFEDHAVDALRYAIAQLIKVPGEKR